MSANPPPEELSLAADFPAATREDWLKLVAAVLKGTPFEKKLVARTYDDLPIQPLYGRDRAATPIAGRALGAPWQVLARVDHPDPAAANAEARHEFGNGATGLALVFAGAIGGGRYGLEATEAALARALDGVHLDAIALELDLGRHGQNAAQRIADLVQRQGMAPAATNIRFGCDPLGALSVAGSSARAWREIAPEFAATIVDLKRRGFKGPFAVGDARPIHDAGGSEAQELAFALANATAYLRALEAGGVTLEDARQMIFFRAAVDADQFLSVAKLRALRLLWGRIEEACGLAPKPAFVSAATAWRMMTQRDPWVNLLRTTIATFSAGIAGADAITVLPFTSALGLPDRFARRLARNTQLILLEEANLAKVADPTAGSGAIAELTVQLCRAAWTLFQEIEAAGGAAAALAAGLLQRRAADTRTQREAAIATRRDLLTGTSEFADLAETPVTVLDVSPVTPPRAGPAGVTVEPLPRVRLAEPFERLRDASDRTLATTGARPKVFLATLGTLADFTARASYARNFFEAGGIEGLVSDGFKSRNELIAAFRASGAKLACLCSSDAIYESEAVEAATALAAAGARHIYLAGRTQPHEAKFRASGVEEFIHVGCNTVAILEAAHRVLGTDKA